MTDQTSFQKQAQRIGDLVHEVESIGDPVARAKTKELVQLLMDLHGAGLERILEIVFQAGEPGVQLIDDLGKDPLVSSLLILYGIHPEDIQTRVERKLEQIRPKLHKMGAEVSAVRVTDGQVRLQLRVEGHGCGSTARTVQTLVEEAMYDAAPDLTSLIVEGLDAPAASGFVGLEKLLYSAPAGLSAHPPAPTGAEGMD